MIKKRLTKDGLKSNHTISKSEPHEANLHERVSFGKHYLGIQSNAYA